MRPGDFVARYGGEEFVVLIPGTDQTGAMRVAERVRASVEHLSLPHEANVEFGSVNTVSLGCATITPATEKATAEALVALTDAHLYEAKRTGRNRAVDALPSAAGVPAAADEEKRSATASRYEASTERDMSGRLDLIASLTAHLFHVPMAFISIVGRHETVVVGRHAVETRRAPRDSTYCAHTIQGGEPLVIPDTRSVARFAANAVTQGGVGSLAGSMLPYSPRPWHDAGIGTPRWPDGRGGPWMTTENRRSAEARSKEPPGPHASERGENAAAEARAAAGSIVVALAVLSRFALRASIRSARRVAASGAGRLNSALARDHARANGTTVPAIVTQADAGLGQRRWIRTILVRSALVVPLLLAVPVAYAIYCLSTLPVQGGIPVPNQRALVMQSADGSTIATRGTYRGSKLEAGDLPKSLGEAVVAIEDRRFYQHHGIDLRGTLRAIWRDMRAGGESREGGSTLTQQLVRNTYLSPEKTLRRKVQEALLSLWIETRLSKQEILTRYLNTAYFGAGAYGADAAAHRYFGKAAKELTVPECAMLAGLVRAPSSLAPTRNFGGADERKDVVLQAMVDTGAITAQQGADARAARIELQTPPDTPPGAEYFLDMVAGEVGKLPNGATGDLTLHTTLDMPLQRAAEAIIERRLTAEGEHKNVSQAALVAMRPDGSIVALVGGRDYERSQFNRVTQAQRQPGSLFKLFVYLTAFKGAYTPDSTMVDGPMTIGDWSPQNDDSRYRGRVDLRTAFAESINTVAAKLGQAVGMPAVIATARRLGVKGDLPAVPSLALGSAEVNLLDMTRAYADVAANTTAIEPFGIAKLTSRSGQILYTRPPRPNDAPIGPARDMMVDVMQAVVDQGTGRAAHPDGFEAAGKTGTSQDFRNAWFIGFTPSVTVGVWVGNDDNSPMESEFGGDLPAKIFHDFVEKAEPALGQKMPPAGAGAAPTKPSGASDPVPQADAVQRVRGRPEVIDTGTLAFRDRVVHLQGVEGNDGRMRKRLVRFLRRREIDCALVTGDVAKCEVEGQDLSTIVVGGGGARAAADASPDLLAAEDQARSQRIGIWR